MGETSGGLGLEATLASLFAGDFQRGDTVKVSAGREEGLEFTKGLGRVATSQPAYGFRSRKKCVSSAGASVTRKRPSESVRVFVTGFHAGAIRLAELSST